MFETGQTIQSKTRNPHLDDGLNMLLPCSFAGSIWQLLEESAHQYGSTVE
jgi:hypothetical protein